MKSIVLVGMMGCGKSTCAKLLAKALGREAVDTDAMVVSTAGKTIAAIFETEGESAFRDLETQACRTLSGRDDLIIATGGGLVLRKENVALLRKTGYVIFLNRPAAAIYDSMSKAGRPLAQDGRAAFLERFAAREPCYRGAAHWEATQFATPDATVRTILEHLQQQEGVL